MDFYTEEYSVDSKEEWENSKVFQDLFVGDEEDLRVNTQKIVDQEESTEFEIDKNNVFFEGDFHHIGVQANQNFTADIELEHIREDGLNTSGKLQVYRQDNELEKIFEKDVEANDKTFLIEDIEFRENTLYYIGHTEPLYGTPEVKRTESEWLNVLTSNKDFDKIGEDADFTVGFSKITVFPEVIEDVEIGIRQDNPIDISNITIIDDAILTWESAEGENTNIDFEYSFDETEWKEVNNDQFLSTGFQVEEEQLYLKQILETTDVTRSPLLFNFDLFLKNSSASIANTNHRTLLAFETNNQQLGETIYVPANPLVSEGLIGDTSPVTITKASISPKQVIPRIADITARPLTATRGFPQWTFDDGDISIPVGEVTSIEYETDLLLLSFESNTEVVNNILRPIEKYVGEYEKHKLSIGRTIAVDDSGGNNIYEITPPDSLRPPLDKNIYVASTYSERPRDAASDSYHVEIEFIPKELEELGQESYYYPEKTSRDWKIETYAGTIHTPDISSSISSQLSNGLTTYNLDINLNVDKTESFINTFIFTGASGIDDTKESQSIPYDGSDEKNTIHITPASDNLIKEGDYIVLNWNIEINNGNVFTISMTICDKE